jgi:hypothetical protein
MPADLPLVLKLSDWPALLRTSRRTVERMRRAGELPETLPLRGGPRWSRDVVLAWLNGGSMRRHGRRTAA